MANFLPLFFTEHCLQRQQWQALEEVWATELEMPSNVVCEHCEPVRAKLSKMVVLDKHLATNVHLPFLQADLGKGGDQHPAIVGLGGTCRVRT
jgi:hypothetical protein